MMFKQCVLKAVTRGYLAVKKPYRDSIFTALRVMQTRSMDENSVSPSVRLSVTRVIPGKMEERSVQIFIPYER